VSATPVKIFIGTATTNGVVASDHVGALVRMATRLEARGIGTVYRTVDGPSLFVQRDMLAHTFLESDCTHLLLVDGDVVFDPGLAETLLGFRKRLVGTVTPRRAPDLARVKAAGAAHGVDGALALACDWNVRLLGNTVTVRDGLCQVEAFGLGFALIERECLVEMTARLDPPRYRAYHADMHLRAFFREVPTETGVIADQDHTFCRRWIACGGEVHTYPAAPVRRIGDFAFGVPFAAYLAALGPAR
jgi:hypothetical protein